MTLTKSKALAERLMNEYPENEIAHEAGQVILMLHDALDVARDAMEWSNKRSEEQPSLHAIAIRNRMALEQIEIIFTERDHKS